MFWARRDMCCHAFKDAFLKVLFALIGIGEVPVVQGKPTLVRTHNLLTGLHSHVVRTNFELSCLLGLGH